MADLEHFLRKTPLVLLGLIELSVKSSKESTETVSLLKTGNKVVEVGWVNNKVKDNNSMRRGPSGKQTGYHYLTDNSNVLPNRVGFQGNLNLRFFTGNMLPLPFNTWSGGLSSSVGHIWHMTCIVLNGSNYYF
jgi:hypothetical protein